MHNHVERNGDFQNNASGTWKHPGFNMAKKHQQYSANDRDPRGKRELIRFILLYGPVYADKCLNGPPGLYCQDAHEYFGTMGLQLSSNDDNRAEAIVHPQDQVAQTTEPAAAEIAQ